MNDLREGPTLERTEYNYDKLINEEKSNKIQKQEKSEKEKKDTYTNRIGPEKFGPEREIAQESERVFR
jgi:hypothetical protein